MSGKESVTDIQLQTNMSPLEGGGGDKISSLQYVKSSLPSQSRKNFLKWHATISSFGRLMLPFAEYWGFSILVTSCAVTFLSL